MPCVPNQNSQSVALTFKKQSNKIFTKYGDNLSTHEEEKSNTALSFVLSAFRKWIKYKQDDNTGQKEK